MELVEGSLYYDLEEKYSMSSLSQDATHCKAIYTSYPLQGNMVFVLIISLQSMHRKAVNVLDNDDDYWQSKKNLMYSRRPMLD